MHSFTRIALGLALTLASLSACTTTHIDQFRQAATGIGKGKSIVILGRRQNNSYDTDGKFVECVGTTVANGNDRIRVIPEQEFLDAMFPFFEPRTAPLRTTHLRQLMAAGEASQRIRDYGLEYIVWVDGTTRRNSDFGSFNCSITIAGGGCFGFNSWQDVARFEAEVWNLDTLESVGLISTDSNGQSYMPALLLPIPLIAQVEASACSGLGSQLKHFITGTGT